MIIAHLSDPHFGGAEHHAARAAAVMEYLHKLERPVDAVVVTGDVADHGLPEEYRQAAEVLKYQAPLLFCPGNHDVRAAFRTGLLDLPAADGPIDLAQEIDGVLFAMCDSTVPGRGDGYLADETLEWLDGTGVIVRLDLEGDRQPITDVDGAGVLPRSHDDVGTLGRQPPQQLARVLVGAVL